jgi:hypothetical protein
MSDFLLQISASERENLVIALSCRVGNLGALGGWVTAEYLQSVELLRRLLEAPKLSAAQTAAQAPPPVGIPATAKDARKAPPASSPEPAAPARDSQMGELVITPTKVDQPPDGKSMVVHYRIRTATGVRLTKMHCWDPSHFGSILDTVGQSTTFITKTNAKGFTNIVGVKK